MSKYAAYLAFAENLAKEAGLIAQKYHSHVVTFENKEDASPVTKADLEINRLVIERCTQTYPDIGVLGEEESSNASSTSGMLWVCDPIDGTIPYSMGMGASMFSLALVDDGMPVVGVAYDFTNDRLFSAVLGGGARLNGRPIEVSHDAKPLKYVDIEWFLPAKYDLRGSRAQIEVSGYTSLFIASSVYAGVMVGQRRISGVVYGADKPWDGAALQVVATEMGAKMTDLDGNAQRYDQPVKGFILANEDDFDAILDCVKDTYAQKP